MFTINFWVIHCVNPSMLASNVHDLGIETLLALPEDIYGSKQVIYEADAHIVDVQLFHIDGRP